MQNRSKNNAVSSICGNLQVKTQNLSEQYDPTPVGSQSGIPAYSMVSPVDCALDRSHELTQSLKRKAEDSSTHYWKKARSDRVIKSGRWTEDEHNTFVRSFQEHGNNWSRIMQDMGGLRSIVQIRSHAQKYFKKVKETLNLDVDTNSPDWMKKIGLDPQILNEIPMKCRKQKPITPAVLKRSKLYSSNAIETVSAFADSIKASKANILQEMRASTEHNSDKQTGQANSIQQSLPHQSTMRQIYEPIQSHSLGNPLSFMPLTNRPNFGSNQLTSAALMDLARSGIALAQAIGMEALSGSMTFTNSMCSTVSAGVNSTPFVHTSRVQEQEQSTTEYNPQKDTNETQKIPSRVELPKIPSGLGSKEEQDSIFLEYPIFDVNWAEDDYDHFLELTRSYSGSPFKMIFGAISPIIAPEDLNSSKENP